VFEPNASIVARSITKVGFVALDSGSERRSLVTTRPISWSPGEGEGDGAAADAGVCAAAAGADGAGAAAAGDGVANEASAHSATPRKIEENMTRPLREVRVE
jgi:hypothetical protein